MDKKKIMIIINPESGKSDAEKYKDIIEEQLKDNFDEIIVEYTEEQGDATKLAERACEEKFHSVCSVGGDGTLKEVLNGLVNFDNPPALLIFPAGTGNIFSKQIKMKQNKNNALKNIDFSNPKYFDIGLVNGEAFGFMMSIGQITESIHEVSNEDKEKFGFIAYITNVIKNINVHNDYQLEVKVDDKVYSGIVDHLFISLSENYGNFKIQHVNSSVDDGNLNVFIVKDQELLNKARVGFDLLFGNKFNPEIVEFFKGKKVQIRSIDNNEIYVDLDGDQGPKLPVDIEIISKKIKIYTPYNN